MSPGYSRGLLPKERKLRQFHLILCYFISCGHWKLDPYLTLLKNYWYFDSKRDIPHIYINHIYFSGLMFKQFCPTLYSQVPYFRWPVLPSPHAYRRLTPTFSGHFIIGWTVALLLRDCKPATHAAWFPVYTCYLMYYLQSYFSLLNFGAWTVI